MERLPAELLASAKTELSSVAPSLPGLLVTVYGAPNSRELAEREKLFQWTDEGRQSLITAIYSRRRDAERSRQVQNAMKSLEDYVRSFQTHDSKCVSYDNVLFRLLRENHPANLVIASAKPCDRLELKLSPGVSIPRTVVLIMVGSRNHDQEFEVFQQRELALRRIFSNAQFLSESEVGKIPLLLSGADPGPDTPVILPPRNEKCAHSDAESRIGVKMRLEIVSPRSAERAEPEVQVEGRGACNRDVWLVSYPVGTGTYWVESRAEVRASGTFTGTIILGRGGTIDCGKTYLVRAFESPYTGLHVEQRLSFWPDAEAASLSVAVIRACPESSP